MVVIWAARRMYSARSSHAWGLLQPSPRAGLRAGRYHAYLTAVMTDDENADVALV
ncbi:hypothetical protein ABZ656_44610 [Streptomyces sp. NPDC007095]|uniref:hypothetical protein n=1 Tax=Streptomyces sp. NPDC007095 TaxID=3154482 RepID=UPI0033D46086